MKPTCSVFSLLGESATTKKDYEKIAQIVNESIEPVALDFKGVRSFSTSFCSAFAADLLNEEYNDKIYDVYNLSKSANANIGRLIYYYASGGS